MPKCHRPSSRLCQDVSYEAVTKTSEPQAEDFVNSLKVNMDTLRGAADKIKNSPRLVRRKINHAIHKERLTDDWIHNREQVEVGVMFNIKILGRRETTEEQSKGSADKLVDQLVQKHKVNSKTEKLQKASLMIDCNKLILRDLVTYDLLEDIPVKRICFCTADQTYPKVFALMVAPQDGSDGADGFMYAFLTNKKAMADAIALTVAQAYTMSFEDEEDGKLEKQNAIEEEMQKNAKNLYSDMANPQQEPTISELANQVENTTLSIPSITNSYKEDESTSPHDEEEDEFKAFAEFRQLNTGYVRREQFGSDVTDFLAVNNTLKDLERAASHEDLFYSSSVSPPSAAPNTILPALSPPPPNSNSNSLGRNSPIRYQQYQQQQQQQQQQPQQQLQQFQQQQFQQQQQQQRTMTPEIQTTSPAPTTDDLIQF